MRRKLTVPDWITLVRIAGTVVLAFLRPFTSAFYALYFLCGISDVLDGWIARSRGICSAFGARLDSIADLLFYSMMILKVFPVLLKLLPMWVWCVLGAVLLLRLAAYGVAAVKYRRFASVHTYMNKLTGFLVFLLPCMLRQQFAVVYCAVVCAVAGLASLEELMLHLTRSEYRCDRKGFFQHEEKNK